MIVYYPSEHIYMSIYMHTYVILIFLLFKTVGTAYHIDEHLKSTV